MQSFPEIPPLTAGTPFSGHLWIQELPTGGRLRLQLDSAGALQFGTRQRTAPTAETFPWPYRRGIQYVRAQIDRQPLQAATDDPTAITVFGRVPWYAGVEYDWSTLPPFLGVAIWDATRRRYLPPDAAMTVFDRIGLPSLPAIVKEQPADRIDYTQYQTAAGFPGSTWGDVPAAGVLLRDKSDIRRQAWHSDPAVPHTAATTATDHAQAFATPARINRTVSQLTAAGMAPTVDTVRNRLVSDLAREQYALLYQDEQPVVAMDTVVAVVGERVHRFMADDLA